MGGTVMPGVYRVDGGVRRRVDIKAKKNSDSGVVKDQGYEPARLTLQGQIVSKEELAELESALKRIHPRKGAPKDPLIIVHPSANLLGVRAVMVVEVKAPQVSARAGLEIAIDVVEYAKPKPVKKKKPQPVGGGTRKLPGSSREMGELYRHPVSGQLVPWTGAPLPSADAQRFLQTNNTSQLSQLITLGDE